MKYNIYQIKDSTNSKVLDILRSGITAGMFKNESLEKNYLYDHKDQNSNLFYLLENGRYRNGNYFVVTDSQNNYIASAGWYHYTNDIALLLTRMLVIPKFRGSYVLAHTVLQSMIDQSEGHKHRWITFNEYNLTLYKWFERVEQGKSGALFNNWPRIYSRFKPIGQKEINHTLQWVVELK